MAVRIELAACESVLLQEIGDKRMKRRDVAQTYALALKSSERDSIDWGKVNRAIIARWSMHALTWIKERAWSGKAFEEKHK
jgi:hypothetical protein